MTHKVNITIENVDDIQLLLRIADEETFDVSIVLEDGTLAILGKEMWSIEDKNFENLTCAVHTDDEVAVEAFKAKLYHVGIELADGYN